jgi:hypothetical protein
VRIPGAWTRNVDLGNNKKARQRQRAAPYTCWSWKTCLLQLSPRLTCAHLDVLAKCIYYIFFLCAC